ncbi:MAG: plastocyanin/azurin family copper-binding protein [Gemmatimonadales bacterium]
MLNRSLIGLVLLAAACNSSPKESSHADQSNVSSSVAATGRTIEIQMITDGTGNYYEPKDVEAKPGDVLRFILVSGVHNVNFVADSNPGAANLPPVSDMLQLPGQTHDVMVTMAAGKRYVYQCDPHAALGMIGAVTVVQ